MSQVSRSMFLFISSALLVACNAAAPPPVPDAPVTPTIPSPTLLPATPAVTASPTNALPPASTQALLAAILDELRMVFVLDGNLYLQDGSQQPVQLTYSGQDWRPSLSVDGEKIAFLRGVPPYDTPHSLYVIDADGGQEKVLVTSSILATLNQGYGDVAELLDLTWASDSHDILFNTHEVGSEDLASQKRSRTPAKSNLDLLHVDADTGAITPLLAPGEGGSFMLSPGGDRVAVRGRERIAVITLEGQVVYQSQRPFAPGLPEDIIFSPDMGWAPGGDGITVLLTTGEITDEGPVAYTAWQCPLDGSPPVQIPLIPPPMSGDFQVSPAGDWILYLHFDEAMWGALYLGNLQDGQTRLYAAEGRSYRWSPGGKYFIYAEQGLLNLGAAEGEPVPVGKGRFLQWLDSSRYLFYASPDESLWVGDIHGETVPLPVSIPENLLLNGPDDYAFTLFRPR